MERFPARRLPIEPSPFEKLCRDILKRLEFDRIPTGIQEKHRRLLARLTLETNVRFNYEMDIRRLQSLRKTSPGIEVQYGAEVRHRNVVIVDDIRRFDR